MKRTLLSLAAFLSLAALGAAAMVVAPSVASAADLPRKSVPFAAPVQALPIFTWTGFYVGGTAGYAFETGKSGITGTPGLLATGFAPVGKAKTLGNGFTVGGTVGYNYQFGNVVAGVEADLSYLDLGKRVSTTIGPLTTTLSQDSSYLGTVRGRLGYSFDRVLVYGTGGFAYGDSKASTNISGLASQWSGTKNDTRFGFTVGAGVEYALSNNWSVKAEYLYYDLGKTKVIAPLVAGAGAGAGVFGTSSAQNRGNIVRAGVNYRF